MLIRNERSYFYSVAGRIKARYRNSDWKVVGAINTVTGVKILLQRPGEEKQEVALYGKHVSVDRKHFPRLEAAAEGRTRPPRNIRPSGRYSEMDSRAYTI